MSGFSEERGDRARMCAWGTLVECRPIEWVEGLITGVARFSDDPRWTFVSLLAWESFADERIYGVVPLEFDRAQRILRLLPSAPGASQLDRALRLQQEIERLLAKHRDPIGLVICRGLDKDWTRCVEVAADEPGLRSQLGQSLEEVLADDARFEDWLERIVSLTGGSTDERRATEV